MRDNRLATSFNSIQVYLMTTPNPVSDLAAAAQAIFANDMNSFALDDGFVVEIHPGKMRHIPAVIGFFQAILNRMDQEQLSSLISQLVKKQQEAVASGKSPLSVDMKRMAEDALSEAGKAETEEDAARVLVGKTVGTTSLILGLLSAVIEELPNVIPAFTNLSIERYEEMTMDEAALIAGGIFLVNYRFFTQSLRPVLTAFLGGVMRKQISENTDASKTKDKAVKRITRK